MIIRQLLLNTRNLPRVGGVLDERVMSSCTINEVRTATRKKFSKANLLENALHSRPANEPKPAPPTIRWQQCSSRAINRIAKIILKQSTTGFPHDLLVPSGGLTAWIRGDSRQVAATPECSAMSERDHGATDGLHLGDAGGEEKRCDEGILQTGGVYIDSRGVAGSTTSPSTELKL